MSGFNRFIALLFFSATVSFSVWAMVYDNQFFPLYARTYSRTYLKPSNIIPDLFLMTANDAALNNDESSGIPEIFGKYDQNKLANAIVELGRPNPLQAEFPQLIGFNILWNMKSKLEAQGFALEYNQQVTDHFSFGFNFFAMHVFSRINFELAEPQILSITPEQMLALDQLRREMQQSIGLEAPKFSRGGFSDIDLYFRFGGLWEYTYKFRRIDAGLRIGTMIPTGLTRQVNNPASVPFGGNGHWGVYGALDLEFELKEDWKVGFYGRFSKRFAKKKLDRLTLAGEQPLFGALLAPANIDPGINIVAAPYIRVEDIRDGLGIQANYTYVNHFDDLVTDARPGLQIPPTELAPLNSVTDWSSEYLTLNLFYDFARVRVDKTFAPIVSLMWDIPIQFFGTERVSKTNRISLGIIYSY
jgi:hypothetical protein